MVINVRRFVPWDVLSLGPYCTYVLGRFGLGRFVCAPTYLQARCIDIKYSKYLVVSVYRHY